MTIRLSVKLLTPSVLCFKEQMEKTKKLWQQIKLKDDQTDTGMVAAFYTLARTKNTYGGAVL